MKPSEDTKRMAVAIEDAEIAFWGVIADAYPEAIHGDFAPDATLTLDTALKEAVTLWVGWNADPLDEEMESPVTHTAEIMLHRIEYTYRNFNDLILSSTDEEHIAYQISQGFSEGELCTTIEGGQEAYGYWNINNNPDA